MLRSIPRRIGALAGMLTISVGIFFCFTTLLVSCSVSTSRPTRDEMNEILAEFGLSLPASATDIRLCTVSERETSYYVRFEISMVDSVNAVLWRMGFDGSMYGHGSPFALHDDDVPPGKAREWWRPEALSRDRSAVPGRKGRLGMSGVDNGVPLVYLKCYTD